jgi:hypothetical protein
LRILITNDSLDDRAGSELHVRDIATALLKRGHTRQSLSVLYSEMSRESSGQQPYL